MGWSFEINLGEKRVQRHAQHFGEINQLKVMDINPTAFDFGHSAPINIPTSELKLDRQRALAPTTLATQPPDLATNQIHNSVSVRAQIFHRPVYSKSREKFCVADKQSFW
jgi:hypothetical protein